MAMVPIAMIIVRVAMETAALSTTLPSSDHVTGDPRAPP